MKISKKDLRRIIFENIVLKEQSQATARGARKAKTKGEEERGTRTDADVGELLRRVSEETIIRILDPIMIKKDLASYNVQVKLGQKSVVVNQGSGRTDEGDLSRKELREINKEIKKALKQDPDATGSVGKIRDQLKVGRRVKLNYTYTKGNEPDVAVVVEPEPDVQPQNTPDPRPTKSNCGPALKKATSEFDLVGSNDSSDSGDWYLGTATLENGFVYEKGSKYVYYISTVSGCWYALNTKNCNIFSMKEYPDNMANLDGKFKGARTPDLIARCAGEAPPADPSNPGGSATPTTPPPSTKKAKLSLKEEALIMLMAHGISNKLSARGADLAILYTNGEINNKDSAYKEVIKQVQRSRANPIMNVQQAVVRFITPKSKGGLLDLAGTGSLTRSSGGWDDLVNQKGIAFALKAAFNAGSQPGRNDAAFDIPGFDETDFGREHLEELKNALAKRLGVAGGTLNEAFGKSRGSLIRERYWRRY